MRVPWPVAKNGLENEKKKDTRVVFNSHATGKGKKRQRRLFKDIRLCQERKETGLQEKKKAPPANSRLRFERGGRKKG